MAANDLNIVYTSLGGYTVVPLADLSLLLAPINKVGDTRKGAESSGKKSGQVVVVDHGSSQYSLAFSLGAAADSKWQSCLAIATQYTPI